jgi:hypothetical protein
MQFVEETTGRDPRLSYTCVTPGYHRLGSEEILAPDFSASVTGFQMAKYVMDVTLPGVGRVDMSYNDMPVFRLGEVYLNYAEAEAELGRLTQSDLDRSINRLRDRVGMPHLDMEAANADPDWYLASEEYGYPNVSGADKGVILEIRRERAVELCQEGFRYYDLMRWKEGKLFEAPFYGMYFPGTGVYDVDANGTADIEIYSESESNQAATAKKLNGDIYLSNGESGFVWLHKNIERTWDEEKDYLYPIPTDERNLTHGALTQNPGWDDGLTF